MTPNIFNFSWVARVCCDKLISVCMGHPLHKQTKDPHIQTDTGVKNHTTQIQTDRQANMCTTEEARKVSFLKVP